jgi:lipopolysaccharide/colanic/teichoic acid biosynthesis glycosyltransferase
MDIQTTRHMTGVKGEIVMQIQERLYQVRPGLPQSFQAITAFIGLLLSSPIIFLAAIVILLTTKGPIFFRQKRVGRNGRIFIMYKLRTMRIAHSGLQVTASGDARVTPIGRILRKTKLDELPELWNVIKGDMSLVGPRPEVPTYVDLGNSAWIRALKARPGLTDPMTLRLRNEESLLASVAEDREIFYLEKLQPYKLKGYLEYLEKRNSWVDMTVLWQTLFAVLRPGKTPPPRVEEIIGGAGTPGLAFSSAPLMTFAIVQQRRNDGGAAN